MRGRLVLRDRMMARQRGNVGRWVEGKSENEGTAPINAFYVLTFSRRHECDRSGDDLK